jgi:hypothetical protein
VKVNQQTYPLIQEAQVGKQLRTMDGGDLVNRLDFYHHPAFHQEIEAISTIELHFLVYDW